MSYYGWSNHIIQKKSAALQTTLLHLLQFARLEAIHQNKIIILSYTENDNCVRVCAKDPYAIKRVFKLPSNYILQNNQPLGFHFYPDGRCLTPGTITLTFKGNPSYHHRVIINDSGRPRLSC